MVQVATNEGIRLYISQNLAIHAERTRETLRNWKMGFNLKFSSGFPFHPKYQTHLERRVAFKMSSFRTNIFASCCQRNCSTSELEPAGGKRQADAHRNPRIFPLSKAKKRPQAGADWHRFGTFRVSENGVVVEGLQLEKGSLFL